ncbi:MAG TPA: HAD family hydrolase [Bacillota bacterium]
MYVVLWDVGGTLAERVVDDGESVRRALDRLGLDGAALPDERLEQARALFQLEEPGWRTPELERAGYERIAAVVLGPAATPQLVHRLADELARYPADYQLTPGIRELIAELAAAGCRQAVVSNWPPSLRNFLRWHGLYPFFETVVVSGEEGIVKPDPEIFRRALARLGIAPADAVYVGNDPATDIAPCRQLGIATVHFDPGNRFTGAEARTAAALRRLLRERFGLPLRP